MHTALLEQLKKITPEEQRILEGQKEVQRHLYTSRKEFVIESEKLLEKGKLLEVRPHTRFIHFPQHTHNYVEMVYMCSGSTTHIINGKDRVVLEEGDILLLNQHAAQEILPAGEEDIAVNFFILPEFFHQALAMMEEENVVYDFLVSTLSQNASMSAYLHFQVKDILPVQNLMENMLWTVLHKSAKTNTINQIGMGLLFLNILHFADSITFRTEEPYEGNLVFSLLQYIETHYKDGSLEGYAAGVGQPVYYLSRLLKKHTGYAFKDLLVQKKLQQAAYLLSKSSLPVESIMAAVGYSNSSFFYRKFRERYGMSPRTFRCRDRQYCIPDKI